MPTRFGEKKRLGKLTPASRNRRGRSSQRARGTGPSKLEPALWVMPASLRRASLARESATTLAASHGAMVRVAGRLQVLVFAPGQRGPGPGAARALGVARVPSRSWNRARIPARHSPSPSRSCGARRAPAHCGAQRRRCLRVGKLAASSLASLSAVSMAVAASPRCPSGMSAAAEAPGRDAPHDTPPSRHWHGLRPRTNLIRVRVMLTRPH